MERKTYLGRYQAAIDERGEPMVLDRGASSVTLRAQDTKSGEPVVIEMVRPGPLQQVPLEQVEADARAAQQLEHLNIARLRDFGVEEGDIVYVREFLEGSTLDVWVREHGALPVAAVMRIALQGVNALAAAAFQNVTHRAIQPASLMIVPGQTPDGDWPLVKILNFGGIAPTFSRNGFTTTGAGELALFASPEQLQGGTPDFKSDIYAFGATLWFLLTGVAPRVGMLERSRGIPKNVAAVISRMLASNPDQRPHDPLVLQEDIRACLGRAELRQSIGRRFGFGAKAAKPAEVAVVTAAATATTAAAPTVAAAVPPPLAAMAPADAVPEELETESDPVAAAAAENTSPASVGRFLLRPLAWAAVLLTIGAIAAMTLPGAIRSIRDRQAQQEPEAIGVKVGVPETAANAVAAVPAAPSPAETQTETAASAAPEVSAPQDTAVAANRTAPAAAASPSFPAAGASEQSQPTVAAAPITTTIPDADRATNESAAGNNAAASQAAGPVVASADNSGNERTAQSAPVAQTSKRAEAPARQQQPSAATTSSAPLVAANTAPSPAERSEPAAPAEGPGDSAANAQNNTRQTRTVAKREAQTEPTASQPAAGKTASASAEGERRQVRTASTSKARSKAGSRSGLTAAEQTELEVRQALPITPEDEAALPPVPRGAKRARYLGTTPDGALVFGTPQSSDRLYAAPPPAPERSSRRSRRAAPEDLPVLRAEPVDPEELEELAPPPDEDEE